MFLTTKLRLELLSQLAVKNEIENEHTTLSTNRQHVKTGVMYICRDRQTKFIIYNIFTTDKVLNQKFERFNTIICFAISCLLKVLSLLDNTFKK